MASEVERWGSLVADMEEADRARLLSETWAKEAADDAITAARKRAEES